MKENLNILLVEDNPGDAFLVKFYLEESILKSAQFIHAEYMQSALDILSKNEIDVVLLDLNLPDSKGVETVQSILDHSKDAVVIVLTGLADNEVGVQTVKLGAQDFLVKGQFDGKVLTSSIRYAFERAQLKKQVRELDERIIQFSSTQEIAEIGYWELKINTKAFKLTPYLSNLIGLESSSFEDFKGKLTDESSSELGDLIQAAVSDSKDFDVDLFFNGNDDQFKMKSRSKSDDNLIIGTLQKL